MSRIIVITETEAEEIMNFDMEKMLEDLTNVVESIESLGDFEDDIYFE